MPTPLNVEQVEAESAFAVVSGAPDDVAKSLGTATRRIGGGVALSMRDDPTNFWTKALGFTEPLTEDVIAEVCDFYREQGVSRAVLQLAPSVLPVEWDEIRAKQGITAGTTWVKLAHGGGPVPAVDTSLRVDAVDAEHAEEWSAVRLTGFGMPLDGFRELFVATLAHPGVTAYGAWDGDRLVAGASLFTHCGAAEFAGASTLPEHRDRGAQSALLARRIADATAAGRTVLSAEAVKPAEGERNPSLENMRRLGFEVLYDRVNWVWTP
ncbi:GNAT family N-acetyltransferase [Umezawaea endophytica]|uniref:GNAT family N-acetyltransferase n=1 Tax=Umezawaea endophytica TaxID=1654476 RepID=A0A9X3A0N4_9PSEU|nr:GNAT family N-acetyltransferase [Umezawaea endophytica]MCS7477163.1 GNAT family N-acetyltransferase [Umezawaea endophytica]